MATTTPNYGWPVPTSTDYVKDGATAIEALGDAIDATVFGLPSGSFTYINGSTFTGQSTVSINNCFSSTYQAYRIVCSFSSPSADSFLRFRLRAAGTDSVASYYGMKLTVNTAGSVGSYGDANAQYLAIVTTDSAATSTNYSAFIDIIDPFKTSSTTLFMNNTGLDNAGNSMSYFGGNAHYVSTSYDGFTIYASTGTFSGNIRVYGYSNS